MKIIDKIDTYLNEGKDEATTIRNIIKKKFKLSSRDVSVVTRSGGTSSAVNVTIKTAKAIPFKDDIENITRGLESFERDERTGSILSGGNTFIFVEIEYSFRKKLHGKISDEINKQMGNHDSIEMNNVFGYRVLKRGRDFIVVGPKSSAAKTSQSIDQAAGHILSFMIANKDVKNIKKIG